MGFTLTFAVGFVVSDGRSRNGFAVGRDAPTIARRLMALLYDKNSNFCISFCRLSILIRFLAWLTWISANRPSSLHSGMNVSPVGADFLPSPPALPTPLAWWVSFNRRAVLWANRRSDMQRFSSPVKITNPPVERKKECQDGYVVVWRWWWETNLPWQDPR